MSNRMKIIVVFILTIGPILLLVLFYNANKPISVSYEKAQQRVLASGELLSITDAQLFNGTDSYITLFGISPNEEQTAVFVKEDSEDKSFPFVVLEKGITKKEAEQIVRNEMEVNKVFHVALGIEDEKYVWEVAFKGSNGKMNYVYLSFKDGTWVKRILNL